MHSPLYNNQEVELKLPNEEKEEEEVVVNKILTNTESGIKTFNYNITEMNNDNNGTISDVFVLNNQNLSYENTNFDIPIDKDLLSIVALSTFPAYELYTQASILVNEFTIEGIFISILIKHICIWKDRLVVLLRVVF